MGGMAAQIPIKNDPEANDKAMEGVRADKLREVRAGHDGYVLSLPYFLRHTPTISFRSSSWLTQFETNRTWVAHPALAPIATEIFNQHMPTPNQLFRRREDYKVGANDLLNMNVPGKITEEGIRKNLNIGLGYMEAWIRGIGCVPINFLMYVT